MDRGRAGGTGILYACSGLEPEAGVGLENQRSRELLADKAAVHRAEIDGIDIRRPDPGISQGRLCDLDDQRLDVSALMLAELAVRPTNDASAHAVLRCPASRP